MAEKFKLNGKNQFYCLSAMQKKHLYLELKIEDLILKFSTFDYE